LPRTSVESDFHQVERSILQLCYAAGFLSSCAPHSAIGIVTRRLLSACLYSRSISVSGIIPRQAGY
jgi:hypothetical protein